MSCGRPHETPCTEVRALLYVFIDGEIDQPHRIEVTTHLGECPPCEQEFAHVIAVKRRVQTALSPEPAPGDLRARVVASIRQVEISFRPER